MQCPYCNRSFPPDYIDCGFCRIKLVRAPILPNGEDDGVKPNETEKNSTFGKDQGQFSANHGADNHGETVPKINKSQRQSSTCQVGEAPTPSFATGGTLIIGENQTTFGGTGGPLEGGQRSKVTNTSMPVSGQEKKVANRESTSNTTAEAGTEYSRGGGGPPFTKKETAPTVRVTSSESERSQQSNLSKFSQAIGATKRTLVSHHPRGGPGDNDQRVPSKEACRAEINGTWCENSNTQPRINTREEKEKGHLEQPILMDQLAPNLPQVAPEDGVTVVFDVLVASNHKLTAEESLFIRAQGEDFGNFQMNCVDMALVE